MGDRAPIAAPGVVKTPSNLMLSEHFRPELARCRDPEIAATERDIAGIPRAPDRGG